MSFGFDMPWALIALALLAPVVWIERRAWSGLARWRRRTVLGCRLAELTLLTLAVAGLRWERTGDAVAVVFALDVSRSVNDRAQRDALAKIAAATDSMRADDRAGLLVFGGNPLVEAVPQARLRVSTIESNPEAEFTDLSSALSLAAGVYPEGMRRRLVLFSDGNENRGDALGAVRSLQGASVSVDVFPIEIPPSNEVSLTRLEVPGRVDKDTPFDLRIEAMATGPGPATLRLFRDGATIGRQEVHLEAGRNPFSIALNEDQPGFHTYEAIIETPMDQHSENNLAGAFTRVSGPSRVLIVGRDEDNAALTNALDLTRLDYESTPYMPLNLAGLQRYDSIFLNNVAAHEFSADQIAALENYVRDLGGGLGMIGGENSFGPGGWIGTPVERALPVRMEIKTREKFPSLAMVIVVDKSGSMGGMPGSASKMDMANRAAVEAIDLLGPRDLVGVVAFDSAGKWVAPIGPASDPSLRSKILGIAPGGGTDAYQGAKMAHEALASARAQLKHIILLTDGHTAPGNFAQLMGQLAASKITLSTIAIGPGADQTFLDGLAREGGGRYYFCPDPSRVPRIFVRETILVQRSYIIEETHTPTQASLHPILTDAGLASTPPLHGYVTTEIKDRAEPVLRIKGDPLLSVWQSGLGKAVAFTSDAQPRWARDWTGWDGYQAFWDRTIRWSLRSVASTDLHPVLKFDRGRGRLTVDAATAVTGDRLNFLDLKARIIQPDLTTIEVPLRQTAIGTYEAEFDADRPGAYLAGIFDDAGRQSAAGGMVAFSPEFKDFGSNSYLLHELSRRTGGKIEPRVDEIFRREGTPVRSAREISWLLLTLAMLLLLVEVGVRRLHFDEEQTAAMRRVLARLMPLRPATADGPGAETLGLDSGLKRSTARMRRRLRKGTTVELGGSLDGPAAGTLSDQMEEEEGATQTTSSPSSSPESDDAASAAQDRETLGELKQRRRARHAADAEGAGISDTGVSDTSVKWGAGLAPDRWETPATDDSASIEDSAPPTTSKPESQPASPPPSAPGDSGATMDRLLKRKRDRRGAGDET